MRPDFNPLTTHYLPKLDYARAHADGWTLASRDDGTWAIARSDGDPRFKNDMQAYEFVVARAVEGSDDHREAFILDGKTIAAVPLDYGLSGPVQRLFENLTPMSATLH